MDVTQFCKHQNSTDTKESDQLIILRWYRAVIKCKNNKTKVLNSSYVTYLLKPQISIASQIFLIFK